MLKKVYLSCAFVLFAISLFLGIDRVCHHRSSHFSLGKIRTSNLFSPEWGTPTLSDQEMQALRQILNQKFVLYSKGSRSHVCMSEDGRYILKFLKYQHLNRKSWLTQLACSFNPFYQKFLFKQRKCHTLLNAWKAAFTQLKEEAGLIYMHTNNAQPLNQKIVILDKEVQEHRIDLDKTLFCVQKHANLTYLRIAELMQSGDVEKAKGIISSIFSLIDRLGQKGVIDDEFCSNFNFGLLGDEVIQVDIGKLHVDPICGQDSVYKQKIAPMTKPLKNWLEHNYPELFAHFESCLENFTQKSD